MTRRVADLLVEMLQAAGVKTCYGIVGDTMNRIAHAIDKSEIDWVHVRHEEAGAFAAAAEALFTGRLAACAGTCGPGSLHFINGLYEANRNRAPVVLIATQIVRQDLGFESIQEIDYGDVFKGCSVYCEMILTPEQARRKTVAACQAALTKRGVALGAGLQPRSLWGHGPDSTNADVGIAREQLPAPGTHVTAGSRVIVKFAR